MKTDVLEEKKLCGNLNGKKGFKLLNIMVRDQEEYLHVITSAPDLHLVLRDYYECTWSEYLQVWASSVCLMSVLGAG